MLKAGDKVVHKDFGELMVVNTGCAVDPGEYETDKYNLLQMDKLDMFIGGGRTLEKLDEMVDRSPYLTKI